MGEIKRFDYQGVDTKISEFLKGKEYNIKNIAGQAHTQIGKELEEAQRQLAKNNQYDGMFEDWFTSIGMKKQTVYNLINRYKMVVQNLDEQNMIEELPLSLSYEISKPSADEELRKQVLEGDITSLKEFKKLERENKELEKKIEELENQEPKVIEKEVIKEVIPEHLKELSKEKEKLEYEIKSLNKRMENQVSSIDFNKLRKEYEEKVNESHDLKEQIESLVKGSSETKHKEKLKDSALMFCTKIHTFLNDVGGLAWLTEYLDELDEYDRNSYLKALDLLEGWVLTVKSNINKEEL